LRLLAFFIDSTRAIAMISDSFLKLLVCPETQTPLAMAPPELLARLQRLQQTGALYNRANRQIEQPLEGALVRQDGNVAYPIIDNIPLLLIDEGIELSPQSAAPSSK
jgi:uncharacterized protein YbaR (Trm112 family)